MSSKVPPGQEYHFAPQPKEEVQPDDQEGRARTREIYVTESYLEQREIEAQKEVREVESFTRKEIEALGEFDPTQAERVKTAESALERRRERRRYRERERKAAEKYEETPTERERRTDPFKYTPGRRGKPKPGSIADQIDKALRPMFEKQEEAVTEISTGFRTRGKSLMEESRTLATRKIEDFPKYIGVYMGAIGYRYGAGLVEGITFVARPLAWGKTVQNIITIAQRPGPAILAAGYEVISDPFGTIAEVGGALTGGYMAGRAIDYTLGKYQRYRQAKFEAGVTAEDFLPFEEQYRYPSEVTLDESELIDIVKTKGVKAPEVEATLMPRGKWPKGFDVFKKGGTAVITEPGTGLVTEWKPIIHLTTVSEYMPGVQIGDISPTFARPFADTARMLGTLGATKALTDIKAQHAEIAKIKVDTKLETVVTEDVRLATIQPPTTKTISETQIIQDMEVIQIPDIVQDITPVQIQRQRQRIKGIQETVLAPLQEQEVVQETAYAIPVIGFPSRPTRPPVFVPRLPRMGRVGMFGKLKKRGEFRTYPISLPKYLLKMRVK